LTTVTVLAARETCPRPWADPIGVPVSQQLALHGDRVALMAGSHIVSYRDLADRVATRATELGVHRRLVLVAAANDVETVVTYLAALSSGHPVLLVPRDDRAAFTSLVDGYDPDVIAGGSDGTYLVERRAGTRHDLHPDLALLMSTSGSTGSPKLVRLSADNVQANAAAIGRTWASTTATAHRRHFRSTTATDSRWSTAIWCGGPDSS